MFSNIDIEKLNASLIVINQILYNWVAEFVKVYKPLADAFASFCFIRPGDDDEFQAEKDYAAWYNARHPERRVSWRRLNRKQVSEARDRFGK